MHVQQSIRQHSGCDSTVHSHKTKERNSCPLRLILCLVGRIGNVSSFEKNIRGQRRSELFEQSEEEHWTKENNKEKTCRRASMYDKDHDHDENTDSDNDNDSDNGDDDTTVHANREDVNEEVTRGLLREAEIWADGSLEADEGARERHKYLATICASATSDSQLGVSTRKVSTQDVALPHEGLCSTGTT